MSQTREAKQQSRTRALGVRRCPNCSTSIVGAQSAAHGAEAVHYLWACDGCGHAFVTKNGVSLERAA